jgi:hypothetical protein
MCKPLYQFIVSDYSATGEGRTVMILITRAYPKTDDYATESYFDDVEKVCVRELKPNHTSKVRAGREFIEEFGGYYAGGAENLPQEDFLERFEHYIPEYVKHILDNTKNYTNLHFKQTLHLNFS